MSEITEKRAEALASNILECHDVKPSEVKALAVLALLALRERAEPVAWRWRWSDDAEGDWRYTEERRETRGSVTAVPLYTTPPAQPVAVPDGIHPDTADLVTRFAAALAEKLHKAEQNYGYSNGWMRPDWYNECLQSLWEHIEKGDPRDVAAYCAFMWHHGWITTDYDRNVPDACRAAMLAAPGKN